jgi:hypothetical protein
MNIVYTIAGFSEKVYPELADHRREALHGAIYSESETPENSVRYSIFHVAARCASFA